MVLLVIAYGIKSYTQILVFFFCGFLPYEIRFGIYLVPFFFFSLLKIRCSKKLYLKSEGRGAKSFVT